MDRFGAVYLSNQYDLSRRISLPCLQSDCWDLAQGPRFGKNQSQQPELDCMKGCCLSCSDVSLFLSRERGTGEVVGGMFYDF